MTDIEEELLGCEGSSVSEVGVINEVDIDNGTQNMEVLAPLEEQQEQEFATGIIAAIGIMEKDVMQSGDSQVGGAIRDDSIVSIMSMGYEGCCFQEESMETQRQGHGAVDYDYDYGGDVSSAKFEYGRPAFTLGGIGMFVITGRPPGRLIGG